MTTEASDTDGKMNRLKRWVKPLQLLNRLTQRMSREKGWKETVFFPIRRLMGTMN